MERGREGRGREKRTKREIKRLRERGFMGEREVTGEKEVTGRKSLFSLLSPRDREYGEYEDKEKGVGRIGEDGG